MSYLKAVSGALCRDSAQACWMAPSTPDHGSLSERPGRSPEVCVISCRTVTVSFPLDANSGR